jgi:hypothetical protein
LDNGLKDEQVIEPSMMVLLRMAELLLPKTKVRIRLRLAGQITGSVDDSKKMHWKLSWNTKKQQLNAVVNVYRILRGMAIGFLTARARRREDSSRLSALAVNFFILSL